MTDLNKIQKNVLHICTTYPEAINNRSMLLERYWHEIDGWNDNMSLYWNLSRSTRPETITRRFREIREMGLIRESKDTEKKNIEAMQSERDRVKYNYQAVSWLND